MSLSGGTSDQLQLDSNQGPLVARRHSSATNTLPNKHHLHYAADWIRATTDSVRAYRAASIAMPITTTPEERSLLDILMQQDVDSKPSPTPPPAVRRHSSVVCSEMSDTTKAVMIPPPLPPRPPPAIPERSKPPSSSSLSAPRVPPPVIPRTRPGPPATPPRSPKPSVPPNVEVQAQTNNIHVPPPSKNAHNDSLVSNFHSDMFVDLQSTIRRYSQGQVPDNDIQKIPPPRPQAPAQLRKYSEGNNFSELASITTSATTTVETTTTNTITSKTSKIPPPIQTMENITTDDEVKPQLPTPQFEVSSGSCGKISMRQDSNVSSDSFSQNSSPSYTTKSMETPLLAHSVGKNCRHTRKKYLNERDSGGRKDTGMGDSDEAVSANANMILDDANNGITKSHSTPASLQTIVRFHHGSNMSLHHRIIRDIRRPSTHYITRGRLNFQFAQVILNAIALLAIAGGLAAYFKAYPTAVRYVNKTVTTTTVAIVPHEDVNPAPGICLPVIVTFCIQHKIPYNFTMFPNYIGHFTQRDAQQELEVYDAVVDVRCYELAALFLCSVFVPKCGPAGELVRPCRSLCFETKRRCGFFLEVFGLTLPEYLNCELFPESPNSDVCVGHNDVIEAKIRAQKPVCHAGFQCDIRRCIPADWKCDGHVDCEDQSDELNCEQCAKGMIHCGANRCMSQSHMCDGIVDCPWGQDERNCMRLSERMGDIGRGKLEVFQPELQSWRPACVTDWDPVQTPKAICSLLGYTSVNASGLAMKPGDASSFALAKYTSVSMWRLYQKQKRNLLKELRSCSSSENYPTLNLSCTNYACGIRRQPLVRPTARIIGGVVSKPGDWPFLAALLGGPEQIFYCAGVLISDQWVLTASHCVGNFSHAEPTGWTIQLGITRRQAHSYFGQKVKVKRVVPHPMYNMGVAHDNDVALFQLQSRVTFHEHLLPVCLPPPNHELVPGTKCTVIGWGKREDTESSEYEAAVNEVQVPVLNRDLCNIWLENKDLNVTQGMICAGYEEGGKDACQGDSGGPLLCQMDGKPEQWFVGGIVSWGIKCAHPHLPGVYAYVPRYVPWIKQQMSLYSSD